ncbi:hypothetical protein GNZ06_19340 [Aeromonas jandaei]|uniref:hypothetical protein n=1 Tax=Aeromonas jandaei TaxID=650 RepID=UPI0019327DD2|nr:hypothetical protein [Aeromonas jandaei]MBM0493202.1 hypothetical protein [Aeromonas jandaei]MBM0570927.1 hypothetical protein [Aeromonas jandaei]
MASMINVLVVSEFNIIKDLLRSALKNQQNVGSVTLSNDSTLTAVSADFSFNRRTDTPDVVVYDLDSLVKTPQCKLEKMLDSFKNTKIARFGLSSLIIVASETQLKRLQDDESLDGMNSVQIITKPFTFRQVTQVVNNVWTSNQTN